MPTTPCCRTILARSPSAEVARCSCGHIHLSLGPMTLRMDEDTLHALWHTLGDALTKMTAAPEPLREMSASPSGWKQ